jgi:hypothetical protein
VQVGDQVSTCGFSARLNRSQSRYHRGPDWPHEAFSRPLVERLARMIYSAWATRVSLSVGCGDDPAKLPLGELHKAVASSKLFEDITFNDQRMRTREIDE